MIVVPMIALAWRNLAPLGRGRQALAASLRALGTVLLAAILAQPMWTEKSGQLTVITVIDRSQSVPLELQKSCLAFLSRAASHKGAKDLFAVVDVAEAAAISRLPGTGTEINAANTSLTGEQTRLAAGVQTAMAIAPPGSAVRILLASDGNETAGDLRDAARAAAANGIPIDVLPLHYSYKQEVVFRNLAAPAKARSGQTIPLRFVLTSTGAAHGRLVLTLNGAPVKLDPSSPEASVPVELKPGTNVKSVSIPVGTRGMHEFVATFIPDDPQQDSLSQNNRASAITFVAGPGHVLVVDADGTAGSKITEALKEAKIDARYGAAADFPTRLPELLDCDAVILVNTDTSSFSYQQQEMLCRYVNDLGGGLVMVGGPNSFGAGGWIGSPVADILPVDLDPPQKKEIPKGALVMVMHACEMPQGNYWGKQVAIATVNTLSRQDLVGVLDYSYSAGNGHWVSPFGEVGDKGPIIASINQMEMGDMPDFGGPMQEAYNKLRDAHAGQKHVIIISDGDPAPPSAALLQAYKKAGITVSGVVVFPHGGEGGTTLREVAGRTGGRYYEVMSNPESLPQIFIKEAQVVRRSLIVEETVKPALANSLHEIVQGQRGYPALDGYVLSGKRGGLSQVLLATPGGDPLLAAGQVGLGRCVAFTSSADSRWAAPWIAWGGFPRFWEQVVRWVGKSSQPGDCEVYPDVDGRHVTLTVESADAEGKSIQFSQIAAQVIAPDMASQELSLRQVGPGRYRGEFQADSGGSYLVNLHYRKVGDESPQGSLMHTAVSVPYAPEFRDLTDNAALLSEVASVTGGRVLLADPDKADMFSSAGVRFPQSAQPLTQTLILLWLAVFLADVAARRVAVNWAAVGRRLSVPVRYFAARLRPGRSAGATLEQLKSKRQELLEQLAARKKQSEGAAGRRYEAPADSGTQLDAQATARGHKGQPAAAPGEPAKRGAAKAPPPPPAAPMSHLDQLLKAKKQAQGLKGLKGPRKDDGGPPPGGDDDKSTGDK